MQVLLIGRLSLGFHNRFVTIPCKVCKRGGGGGGGWIKFSLHFFLKRG